MQLYIYQLQVVFLFICYFRGNCIDFLSHRDTRVFTLPGIPKKTQKQSTNLIVKSRNGKILNKKHYFVQKKTKTKKSKMSSRGRHVKSPIFQLGCCRYQLLLDWYFRAVSWEWQVCCLEVLKGKYWMNWILLFFVSIKQDSWIKDFQITSERFKKVGFPPF